MPYGQYFIESSGITLFRELYSNDIIWSKLFLRDHGIITATVPAFGKNSFGGDTEPFCWGNFSLRRKQKGKNYHIEDIDIKDDMFNLRLAKDKIVTAFKWSKAVLKYLPLYQPDNELLAKLYWNMKLLCDMNVPSEVSDWRFIWHWLRVWGLAPDINKFCQSKKFNRDETILLAQITGTGIKDIIKIFSSPSSPIKNNNIRKNTFKFAAESAYKFLNQI